jgi:hypothetical protein
MMLRKFKLENYLFGPESESLSQTTKAKISKLLKKEMLEIYECKNIYGDD